VSLLSYECFRQMNSKDLPEGGQAEIGSRVIARIYQVVWPVESQQAM